MTRLLEVDITVDGAASNHLYPDLDHGRHAFLITRFHGAYVTGQLATTGLVHILSCERLVRMMAACQKKREPGERDLSQTSNQIVARGPQTIRSRETMSRPERPHLGLNCVICLEPLVGTMARRQLACHHVYHLPCINRWLADHSRCPLCRAEQGEIPRDTSSRRPSSSSPIPIVTHPHSVRMRHPR